MAMQSYWKDVIPLSECSAELVGLVGGKAAGLGELIRLGERVPPGFCVTTEATGRRDPAGGDRRGV